MMGTTRRTVRYHISNILSKTGYKNKTRLAVAAGRCSLIVPTLPEDPEAALPENFCAYSLSGVGRGMCNVHFKNCHYFQLIR